MTDFEMFWAEYPRKKAKLDALKAYQQALKLATPTEILDGVRRYRENLPDEMRFVKLPAGWLRDGRWMDEDDEQMVKPKRGIASQVSTRYAFDWFEECKQVHGGACELDRHRHLTRMDIERDKAGAA